MVVIPMAGKACKTVFKILEETQMLDHVQDVSEYLITKLGELVKNMILLRNVAV